jgi:hypothetical protein
VTQLRNGEHKSLWGFAYPIAEFVSDPNAEVGHHEKGIHLIGNPASDQLNDYGSHPLAVIPALQLWDPPEANGAQPKRCWHSSGVTSWFCLTCSGLTADDLNNPDFWHDLTKTRKRKTSRKTANNDEFFLRLPRNSVWHKEREVAAHAA